LPRLLSFDAIARIGSALFEATGAPDGEARLVADELATSSAMGHDSHGAIRIPEYVALVERGTIIPGARCQVKRTEGSTAIVDCGHNFGAVGAHCAIATSIELARRNKVACVVTRRCNHVGRVGAYVQKAAENGLIAIATCSSPVHGHFVLPWYGTQGRLGTNPIAYAVPKGGNPIMADISTCVAPEGKIRVYKNQGQALPEGWIVDAQGQPTTDPAAFYGPPMGAILPLGGLAGHKGFALGLLVEILGSALAGLASTDSTLAGNGVCFVVIDPEAFCPLDRFKSLVDQATAYVKSSTPRAGIPEVLVPGELEFRTRGQRMTEGIPLDDPTWQSIHKCASKLRVDLAPLLRH
jgi:uncharacterized oxidoreductase